MKSRVNKNENYKDHMTSAKSTFLQDSSDPAHLRIGSIGSTFLLNLCEICGIYSCNVMILSLILLICFTILMECMVKDI